MNEDHAGRYNEKFMKRAIELSEMAYKSGKGLPIGCVIAKNGEIIGEGHNEIFLRSNPTAHGEMVAIEDACMKKGGAALQGCEMYTTLEPCPMCFGAIYWTQVDVVYYANSKIDANEAGFDDSFIFEEIAKPNDKRIIGIHNVKCDGAKKVLLEWKAGELPDGQSWTPYKVK